MSNRTMSLRDHVPHIAEAVRGGATRPGQVPNICPMLVGRVLHHTASRRLLETELHADITLMADGSFRATNWMADIFSTMGVPAALLGLGNATRTREQRRDAGNLFTQMHYLEQEQNGC